MWAGFGARLSHIVKLILELVRVINPFHTSAVSRLNQDVVQKNCTFEHNYHLSPGLNPAG